MKKLYFTSLLAMMVAPAVAAPTHTSNSFPSDGFMEEDYTYQNQATVTNLKVSEGTATTTAQYDNCPAEYPNSDEGAASTDECYTACTVSDFPANSHIASVTGKNYSGANVTDTCAIASCDTGYHLNSGLPAFPDTSVVANTVRYISEDGSHSSDTTGLSTGEWDATWNGVGTLKGTSVCSNIGGDGIGSTLPANAFDNVEAGGYCWCRLTSWTPVGGTEQNLSSVWIGRNVGSSGCSKDCSWRACAESFNHGPDSLRAAFYNTVSGTPSCDANVINITWDSTDEADITANDAGSVTYGGDINTPKKARHINGKIFTGWTFNTPSGN